MLFLSLCIYVITALIICLTLYKTLSFSQIVSTFFICAFSLNVLIGELLSLAGLLNSPILFVLTQLILCGAFISSLLVVTKPDLGTLLKASLTQKPSWNKTDYFLAVLCSIPLLTLLGVGITTPPNNLDSLHTHLTRIYYWLQHGSLANWSATGLFQLIYPINAHIQGYWLFLLSNNENLFFLIQWFSLLVICCMVYDTARLLRFSVRQSLVSVLVMLTVPVVLLQAYSAQNDLVVVALAAIALRSLLKYFKDTLLADLVLVMLSLAIALGVKQTAFFTLPFIAIILIVLLVRKKVVHTHLPWLALIIPFFIVFSAFKYMQNLSTFHSFFGVKDLVSEQRLTSKTVIQKVLYNTPRYVFDFVDFSGLGKTLEDKANIAKSAVYESLFSSSKVDLQSSLYLSPGFDDSERFTFTTHRDLTEDTAWFGLLSTLLLPISLGVVFIQKDKGRKSYAIAALLYSLSYFLLVLIQRPGWDPYQGRYFILGIFPLIPLLASILPKKRWAQGVIYIVLCLSYIIVTSNFLLLNNSKPLLTARSVSDFQNKAILPLPENTKFQIITKTFLVKRTNQLIKIFPQREAILGLPYYEQLFYSSSSTIEVINWVRTTIPDSEALYLMIERNPLEYALFGRNNSRLLFPVTSTSSVPTNGYLLIEGDANADLPGFELLGTFSPYTLLQRK